MNELGDGKLIRYKVQGTGEVTALITENGDIYSAYWPHLGFEQPEKNEFGEWDDEEVHLYTVSGWLSDPKLVSIHDPIQSKEQVDMWLMMYPEDKDFIHSQYLHLLPEEDLNV